VLADLNALLLAAKNGLAEVAVLLRREAGRIALDATARRDLRSCRIPPPAPDRPLAECETEQFRLKNTVVAGALLRAWRAPPRSLCAHPRSLSRPSRRRSVALRQDIAPRRRRPRARRRIPRRRGLHGKKSVAARTKIGISAETGTHLFTHAWARFEKLRTAPE